VVKAQTSYAKQICEIEFDSTKLETNAVIETIKKSGYNAVPLET